MSDKNYYVNSWNICIHHPLHQHTPHLLFLFEEVNPFTPLYKTLISLIVDGLCIEQAVLQNRSTTLDSSTVTGIHSAKVHCSLPEPEDHCGQSSSCRAAGTGVDAGQYPGSDYGILYRKIGCESA
jgi:hypothetical protein